MSIFIIILLVGYILYLEGELTNLSYTITTTQSHIEYLCKDINENTGRNLKLGMCNTLIESYGSGEVKILNGSFR